MKRKFISVSITAWILCLCVLYCTAQTSDYSVHANLIYRFTKYIDWPDCQKNGDFIIGVVGDSRVYDELVTLTKNKRVGTQQISIKHFSSNLKLYNCHILFIPEDESNGFEFLDAYTRQLPEDIKQHCIIMMLTTSVHTEDKEIAEKNPYVRNFLNKPLSEDKLKIV